MTTIGAYEDMSKHLRRRCGLTLERSICMVGGTADPEILDDRRRREADDLRTGGMVKTPVILSMILNTIERPLRQSHKGVWQSRMRFTCKFKEAEFVFASLYDKSMKRWNRPKSKDQLQDFKEP